jgi:hypothetical protein
MALAWGIGAGEGGFDGLELASMRQIAHEVLVSLEKSYPELFK